MKIHHAFLLVAILLSGLSQCKKPQPAEVMAVPKPATAGPSYSAVIAKGYVLNREIQAPASILAEENYEVIGMI